MQKFLITVFGVLAISTSVLVDRPNSRAATRSITVICQEYNQDSESATDTFLVDLFINFSRGGVLSQYNLPRRWTSTGSIDRVTEEFSSIMYMVGSVGAVRSDWHGTCSAQQRRF